MGVMVTYGAYLPSSRDLPFTGFAVVIGDTLVGLVGCLIIFPAVFSLGMAPAQGPGLAFVVLPEVFQRMPGGGAAATAFFLLLLIAAVASLVALLEVFIAVVMANWGWKRWVAAVFAGVMVFLIGLPVTLGEGTAWLQFEGWPSLLDMVDRLTSYVLLPVSAIGIALVVGWQWQKAAAAEAAGLPPGYLRTLWWLAMRWLVPALLGLVLVTGLLM